MVLPFDFVEGSTCRFLNGALTSEPLPAPHGRIDVAWVELDAVTDAASTLGCDHRRAASQERIKHDVSTGRAVQNGISHQLDRRDRRLKSGQIPLPLCSGPKNSTQGTTTRSYGSGHTSRAGCCCGAGSCRLSRRSILDVLPTLRSQE